MVLDFDKIVVKDNGNGRMFIWCPACSAAHIISTLDHGCAGNCNFNNDYYSPTFNLESGWPYLVAQSPHGICCFNVANGIISYHKNSTHIFSGQSVEMRQRKDWGGIKVTRDLINGGFQFNKED